MSAEPPVGAEQAAAEPIQIGSRLELFVDDFLIDRFSGALTLNLHSPRRAEIVLEFDRPWEGRTSAYVSVFQDGDLHRMYYRGGLGERGITARLCYAESRDGIHWDKPELNIFEFEGSKKNNIVWMGVGSACGLGVFKDQSPDCRAEERYKALSSDGYNKPVYALASSDAIHWHLVQEKPVIDEYDGAEAAYDSEFSTRWDPVTKRYVVYHRIWYRPVEPKVRTIAVRTSVDFVRWTPLQRLNFGDAPVEHFYTNAITPYFRAPHVLVGLPMRFMPHRRAVLDAEYDGVSDAVFITSRDGVDFDRRFMEAFIRPGPDTLNWLSRTNMVAVGILPTSPDEMSIYFTQHYNHPTCHLVRGVLRTDGFVSAHAPYKGGELVTRPIVFTGQRLVINFATSAAGSVAVEIQDTFGRPLPGFALEECPEIYGDEIEHPVEWQKGGDVSSLAGRPVKLRFVMKDADLYSIRFAASQSHHVK